MFYYILNVLKVNFTNLIAIQFNIKANIMIFK